MQPLPAVVRELAAEFRHRGHELYVVGGAVRDATLNLPVKDYDFATSATPAEVTAAFRRVIPTGIKHGTVTVLFRGQSFEVTTYRVEGAYADHRRPETVAFTRSLHEDLSRRDFTMNAMARDPVGGALIDPFDGQSDIRAGIIRTVGDPSARIREDALRILRAFRFAARLEFRIDSDLESAIGAAGDQIRHVSSERIAQELDAMMDARRPSLGYRYADRLDVMAHLIPELIESRAVAGCPDVFEHLLASCDCAPIGNRDLRWAALLHDVAKPRCIANDSRGLTFIGHDAESARMAETILSRLRFAGSRIEWIAHLIRNHMYGYSTEWSDAAVRRFIARVGQANVPDLVRLRAADRCGKAGRAIGSPTDEELLARVEQVLAAGAPLTRNALAVNGRDVMAHLDIPPGPTVGTILDELFEAVLADPSLNDRDRLLEISGRFARDRLGILPKSP